MNQPFREIDEPETMGMHPACEICRGACCEGLTIDFSRFVRNDDILQWLQFHGPLTKHGTALPCKCLKLGEDGKCTIYESRPNVCKRYDVAGIGCMDAIKRRRPELKEKILQAMRDNGDIT